MMHHDIPSSNWDPKSKRSSALFSVLKWFSSKDTSPNSPPPDLIHSAASSSCSSVESVFSTDTVASFAFVPPCHYRPFGAALQAEKYILSGPETNTYRARIARREASREEDKNLTLRSKYNLYKPSSTEAADRGHSSLPLMTKTNFNLEEDKVKMHRTASESSKVRKAGVYCHVKGKRKAPQPPGNKGENTLRRKKRMAPKPPNSDVICNDSLKLDHGILKPVKEQFEASSSRSSVLIQNFNGPQIPSNQSSSTEITSQVSPRPWYKRTLSKNHHTQQHQEKQIPKEQEKRKSGMSFLTNISELDREAMEIINKENLKQKYLKNSPPASNSQMAPAFMRPKNDHTRTNSDSWISPKRRSARDLIAKFNAITGVSKPAHSSSSKESSQSPPILCNSKPLEFNIPILKEEPSAPPPTIPSSAAVKLDKSPPILKDSAPKSPVTRTTAVVKPISRSQWNCPKCTLENDYWRIICRVCSTIKPYFDDFTTPSSPVNLEDASKPSFLKEDTTKKETGHDLFGLEGTEFRISELQRTVFQSQYPKISILSSTTSYNLSANEKKPDKEESKTNDTSKSVFQSPYPKISSYNWNLSEKKSEKEDGGKPMDVKIKADDKKFIKPDGKSVEKMILGDEISVEKPNYINVNKYETIDADKNNSDGKKEKKIVEKMSLGEEISVTKKTTPTAQAPAAAATAATATATAAAARVAINDSFAATKIAAPIRQKKDEEQEKQDSAKREEREKLKRMLIEMKNSLPKRPVNRSPPQNDVTKHRVSLIQEQAEPEIDYQATDESSSTKEQTEQKQQPETNPTNNNNNNNNAEDTPAAEKTAELIVVTTETVYENIKVKKNNEPAKPVKVSSAAQTSAVFRRSFTEDEKTALENSPAGFQLIGAKDFVGISNEKTGRSDSLDAEDENHTYANLNAKISEPSVSSSQKIQDPFAGCSKNDTLEINRLLRRLETSIANGELGQASVYARELAQLKVPLNVIRQKTDDAEKTKENGIRFNVDMYVEDKVSHRGPFPLQVSENMTVVELKLLVEEKYKIPVGVQRWILGKELAADDKASLGSHQIKNSGCPIFLYLVAPINNDIKIETAEIPIEVDPPDENNENAEANEEEQTTQVTETVQITEINEDNDVPRQPWPAGKVYNVPIAIIEEDIEEDDEEGAAAALPRRNEVEIKELEPEVWKCLACTLLNYSFNQECEVCGLIRGKEVEAKGEASNQTYMQLVNLDNEDLVKNVEGFECLVCLTYCMPGEGVTLRECLHEFCRYCLANTVEFSEDAEVKCPYRDDQYACDIALQDREVKALVTPTVYEQHLAKSVKLAENKMDNTFHCKTPDCKGWCIYEDNVNEFYCPVCRRTNCLTCQAIHTGRNCKQYQEQMRTQSETDEDARRTRDFLEDMIKTGEALGCPTCQVVLLKKWGCDWVRCSMCKTEICWVTRGPRWGPGGKGDTTGGCKCGVNGIKCHPKCNYCH